MPLASSGALNVALHRHLGPVTILLSLTPSSDNSPYPQNRSTPSGSLGRGANSRNRLIDTKSDDMESIYGLYSDLMKVGDFVGGTSGQRRTLPPSHHPQLHHQPVTTTRMGWDLTSMAISDESVVQTLSESTSNGGIYQDGMNNAGRVSAPGVRPRIMPGGQGMSADGVVNSTGLPSDASNSDDRKIGISGGQLEEVSTLPSGSAQGGNGYGEVRSGPSGNNPYGELGGSRPLSRRSAGSQGASGPPGPAGGVIQRRETVYSDSPINGAVSPSAASSLSGNKTALLITGGNGYKRGTHDNPYSSQHAHCIIWEYKL